ncbi:MAG: methyltransferase family protein [Thermoplasmatota archaeon]
MAVRTRRLGRALLLSALGMVGTLLASQDPARAIGSAPVWATGICMTGWLVTEAFVLRQDEPTDYRGRRNTRAIQGAVLLGALLAAYDYFHWSPIAPRNGATLAAGIVLVCAGAALRFLAIRALDEHFRYELRVAHGQRLVERGPYSLLRHPSYTGILLIAAGATVIYASVWGFILGVGLTIAFLLARIREEESVLRAAFGPAYLAYASRTWRLVPFVY